MEVVERKPKVYPRIDRTAIVNDVIPLSLGTDVLRTVDGEKKLVTDVLI